MTKKRYKNYMKKFWDKRWYYRTIDQWVDILTMRKNDTAVLWSSPIELTHSHAKELLEECLEKLILEKKISKDQAESLRSMSQSQDEENVYLAINAIAAIKPNAFR